MIEMVGQIRVSMRNSLDIFFRFCFILCLFSPLALISQPQVIEVLVSSENRIYDQTLSSLQAGMDSELKITYLDLINSEPKELEEYFQKIESSSPILITLGSLATKTARDKLKNVPVLFTMVNAPKLMGMESGNLCGVNADIPISDYFKILKEIKPETKYVYTFYSNPEGDYSSGEGDYIDIKYKLYFYRKKIDSREIFLSELQKLDKKMDAFLIINDPLYGKKEFEEISEYSKKNSVILMTSFPALVKAGATFGLIPDYNKIGNELALMANRILAGTSSCSNEGLISTEGSKILINEEYANLSNIYISREIIDRSNVSRLLEIALLFFKENKLNSARAVFETILAKEPENKIAISHIQLIQDRQSGNRTEEFLKLAEKYLNEKKYAQARLEFQKVLKVNPGMNRAKEGINTCIVGQSETERASANHAYRNGEITKAIQLLQASLKSNPNNQLSKNDLQSIRTQSEPLIQEKLKTGILQYNEREYEKAIEIFDLILMIQPTNKEALEYQRLSNKKKEAIQNLRNKSKKVE